MTCWWWGAIASGAIASSADHRREQLGRRAMRPEEPGCFERARLGAERAGSGIVTATPGSASHGRTFRPQPDQRADFRATNDSIDLG